MLHEKLDVNPSYFYRNTAFLDIFTGFIKQEDEVPADFEEDDDEAEPLD